MNQPPPISPPPPTTLTVLPSTTTLPLPVTNAAMKIREVVHAASTVTGGLLLGYQAVILSLQSSGFTSVHPNPVAAAIGAALVALSSAIDSWWNVNQTTNAINTSGGN